MKQHIFKETFKEWYEMEFNELIETIEHNQDLYKALQENMIDCEYEEIPLLIMDYRQIENITEPTYLLFRNHVKELQIKYLKELEEMNESA